MNRRVEIIEIYNVVRNYLPYRIYYQRLKKHNPILLASYPKSGNTWWRFIYSYIINELENWHKDVITFTDIDSIVPPEKLKIVNFPYKSIPPAIKTHRLYRNYYKYTIPIYIFRNPLDVMVSQYHHMTRWAGALDTTINRYSIKASISRHEQAIAIQEMGIKKFLRMKLDKWIEHYNIWTANTKVVCSYYEMKQDPYQTTKRILNSVGITIPDEIIMNAVKKSDAKKIREVESNYGQELPKGFISEKLQYNFVRNSSVGQWKDYFDDDDVEYVAKRLKEFNISLDIFKGISR
jgi:hypothetical protein